MTLTPEHYNEFTEQLYSIKDILRWMITRFESAELFYGHGTDNAWDEAIVLLQFYFQLDTEKLSMLLDSRVTETEKSKLYNLIKKRINDRMPMPYITNQAWFADMEFYVDSRVLIPRSPFAELINNNFDPFIDLESYASKDLDILEIGTGSACIPCAIANNIIEVNEDLNINLKIDATDVSDDALEVAKINISDYCLEENINLIKSDLFNNLDSNKKYDLIVSNPPYVGMEEMNLLPEEFLNEPQGALAAGQDGLDLVRKMLKQASNYLKDDNSCLIVEVGASEEAMIESYPDVPFMWLEFENGGSGVFMITKEQLIECNKYF